MTLRIERYKNTRHWAVYEGENLVVVTVYKRGAAELLRRLAAQPPAAPAAAQALAVQARALAQQAQAAALAVRARAQPAREAGAAGG